MVVEEWGIVEGTVQLARIVAEKTEVLEKMGHVEMVLAWRVVETESVQEPEDYDVVLE